MRSARVTAMKTLNHLVGGSGDIRERDPGVLIRGQTLPAHEVFVALAELASIENRVDLARRRVVWVQ